VRFSKSAKKPSRDNSGILIDTPHGKIFSPRGAEGKGRIVQQKKKLRTIETAASKGDLKSAPLQ